MVRLQEAATERGWSCEVGPSGSWIKLDGRQADVYVIQRAKGGVFSVVRTDGGDACDVIRYKRAEDALEAAISQLGSC